MDAQDFIPRIEAAGFTLEADGADIVVRPFSRLTDSQRQFIKVHKPELLAILTGKVPPAPSHNPLNDAQLADLITRTAKTHRCDPLAVWRWLDLESIEDVRSGDPAVITAFRADVESAVKSDTLIPDGGHGSPFPGELASTSTPACYPVTCRDCINQEPTDHPALVRCGAGRAAPGACGLWWKTDRHTCPLFAARTSTDDQMRTAAANVDKTLATLGHTKCGAVDTSDAALEKLQADLDRLIRERANPQQDPVILAFQAMGATVKFVDAKPVEDEATTSEATP
jgi:hypothetical protein